MGRRCSLLAAIAVAMALAAPAHAYFRVPMTLSSGSVWNAAAAAGGDGTTLVLSWRRLFALGADGTWSSRLLPIYPTNPPTLVAAGRLHAVAWMYRDVADSGVGLGIESGASGMRTWRFGASGGYATDPVVALDAQGDAVLAFAAGPDVRDARLPGAINVVHRRARRVPARTVVVGRGQGGSLAVGIAPDGRAIVAWREDNVLRVVEIGRSGDVRRLFNLTTCAVSSIVVTAGPARNATVAWNDGCRGIVARRRTSGTFGTVQVVGTGTALHGVADEAGRTTLIWQAPGGDEAFTRLMEATAAARGRFTRAVALGTLGRRDQASPAISTARGRVVIAWTTVDMSRLTANVNAVTGDPRSLGGAAIIDQAKMIPQTFGVPAPAVAINPRGLAVVAFPTSIAGDIGLADLLVATGE